MTASPFCRRAQLWADVRGVPAADRRLLPGAGQRVPAEGLPRLVPVVVPQPQRRLEPLLPARGQVAHARGHPVAALMRTPCVLMGGTLLRDSFRHHRKSAPIAYSIRRGNGRINASTYHHAGSRQSYNLLQHGTQGDTHASTYQLRRQLPCGGLCSPQVSFFASAHWHAHIVLFWCARNFVIFSAVRHGSRWSATLAQAFALVEHGFPIKPFELHNLELSMNSRASNAVSRFSRLCCFRQDADAVTRPFVRFIPGLSVG